MNCHKTLVGVKWSNYLEETFVTYPMIQLPQQVHAYEF